MALQHIIHQITFFPLRNRVSAFLLSNTLRQAIITQFRKTKIKEKNLQENHPHLETKQSLKFKLSKKLILKL